MLNVTIQKKYVQNESVNDETNNDKWECLMYLDLMTKVYNLMRLINKRFFFSKISKV